MEYRNIPGFSRYKVNRLGRVLKNDNGEVKRGRRGGRYSKIYKSLGYPTVCLKRDDGIWTPVFLHWILLTSFVGPKPKYKECRHLDGNPDNYSLTNLVWGTSKENQADRKLHNTCNTGERNPTAKLTEEVVREARIRWKNGETIASLAREYKVTYGTMYPAIHSKTWSHVL